MPYADVTGTQVYFEDTGGDGPAVVLAHPLLLDQEALAPQVAALRDGYRVITWDCRGHGRSAYNGAAFDIWDLAGDLVGLLDHLELDRVTLGGVSLGGEISLRAALLAPTRVRALALCGTLAGVESPTVRAGYEQLAAALRDDGLAGELAGSLIELLVDDVEARRRWVAKRAEAPADAVFHAVACAFGRDDVSARLGDLTCPALVLHGDADPLVAMVRAQWLAEALPGCSGVVAVEGAGHVVTLTHPEAVDAALRKFLDGLPADADRPAETVAAASPDADAAANASAEGEAVEGD